MSDHEQDEQIADEVELDETPEEAAKRKFREALERKKGGAQGGAGGGKAGSKIHGTHAQAGGKRTFRRKAGG